MFQKEKSPIEGALLAFLFIGSGQDCCILSTTSACLRNFILANFSAQKVGETRYSPLASQAIQENLSGCSDNLNQSNKHVELT